MSICRESIHAAPECDFESFAIDNKRKRQQEADDERISVLERECKRLQRDLADAHAKLHRRESLPAPEAKLDLDNIGFKVRRTHGHCRYTYANGKWDEGVMVNEPIIDLHIHSAVLHYGVSLFEGIKAFHMKDGSVRVMNDVANVARMARGADRLVMPIVPEEIFQSAIDRCICANTAFIPPYGSGGALYIRPLLFASGAILGLQTAPEFTFLVTVLPAGNYFGSAGDTGIKAVLVDTFDRAAAKGTGAVKAGGNYAADLLPLDTAKKNGFTTTLYTDAVQHKYIEEFSVSNFVGIKAGKFVTPSSASVLPSITNTMLQQLAKDMGIPVEVRPVDIAELKDFDEVGGCGTAVVLAWVKSITFGYDGESLEYPKLNLLAQLKERLEAIQRGDFADVHNWMRPVRACKGDMITQGSLQLPLPH